MRRIIELCQKLCAAVVLLTAVVAPGKAGGIVIHRPPSAATAAQIEGLENYSLLSLTRVHFPTGHSNPGRGERQNLNQIVKPLAENSGTIIELRGYADGAARAAANVALSLERARVIARFLIAHGVARERILILGLGEVDPTGPPRRAEQQRVDLRVFAAR
jgi:outer membrane protein OmpA-like peptidoglycan-associated protein